MLFAMVIGIANVPRLPPSPTQSSPNPRHPKNKTNKKKYSIYQSSIDYTVAAYGVYAASATGGNDFARDFLAGIAALYSTPMYENIGHTYSYEYASTILACVSLLVTIPIYFFYRKGPAIRAKSPFARKVMEETRQRKVLREAGEKRGSGAGGGVEGVGEHVETVMA